MEWGRLQDDFYSQQLNSHHNKTRTGQRWQVALIGRPWNQWFLVRSMRNTDLHGADPSSRTQAVRQEVERSLRDIYDICVQMEPSVQTLLLKI
jgi:hypothetical protein